mmetsp:Transcript_37174/g.77860  ORF Transcript_37174/g.77860 Transcript_37174/m.77860 type:complete len:538 (+) Transcript_37174:69-1682(+)
MFSLATGIYQSYFAPPKLSILIIGCDGSGKTSLLERIKVTDINARLDVNNAAGTQSSTLRASYAKGAVALGGGVGTNNDGVATGNGQQQQQLRRQPRRVGQHHDGGKPARLPPPLPLKQALKSRISVEKIMEDGFSNAATKAQDQENGTFEEEDAVNILHGVPPPPLAAENDNNAGATDEQNSKGGNEKQTIKTAKTRPPLPLKHDAIEKNTTLTPLPTEKTTPTTTKKKSFIELLRCPSPAKYSNASLGEEEDEAVEVEESQNENENPANNDKDALEPWSTEYLEDYYINYQEGVEFDIKQFRGVGGNAKKMFPMDRIRPTLGQNLAKLDLCGCKCSLFDLSGAEKMRPLWERYYRDTDAVIYVVNAAETSLSNLLSSRREFEQMCQNDALSRRVKSGLPILIFANQLDVAYKEYGASMEKANNEKNGRGISWNADEEDDFVGGTASLTKNEEDLAGGVSNRVVDFYDLVELFGFPQSPSLGEDSEGHSTDSITSDRLGNVFLFGGSAKSGEGVRAAMEYLVAHAKSYHLSRQVRP